MRPLYRILLAGCTAFLLPGHLMAQWVQTSEPYQGVIYCLVANGSTVYAGTGAGAYISTDGGGHWANITNGFTEYNVVSIVANGSSLLAGTYGGIFRSSDNGATWTPADSGLGSLQDPYLLSIGTEVYAATYGQGVFVSGNGGDLWAPFGSGLEGHFTECLLPAGAGLIAGTQDSGVFISSGGIWMASDSGITDLTVRGLAMCGTRIFMGTSNGAVFASSNGGVSWQAVDGGSFSGSIRAFAANGTNLFAASEAGGVWVSEDFGAHWADVRSGLPKYGIWSLCVVGSDLLAGTWGSGVWRRPIAEMVTSVPTHGASLPSEFMLGQNFPNPFNPSTIIRYSIPVETYNCTSLRVYDILGREVAVLVNERKAPGSYEVKFDAAGLSSGVYFYTLSAGGFVQTKRLLLLK